MKSIVAILQARMASSRFPGKVLAPVFPEPFQPMIARIMDTMLSLDVDAWWLAPTESTKDAVLTNWADTMGFRTLCGAEEDVFSRYERIIKATGADYVVRVCGDMPLLNAEMSNRLIRETVDGHAEYGTWLVDGTPTAQTRMGMLPEVIESKALLSTKNCTENCGSQVKEHVTFRLYAMPGYVVHGITVPETEVYPQMTVDTMDDLRGVNRAIKWVGRFPSNYRQVVGAPPVGTTQEFFKPYDGFASFGSDHEGCEGQTT